MSSVFMVEDHIDRCSSSRYWKLAIAGTPERRESRVRTWEPSAMCARHESRAICNGLLEILADPASTPSELLQLA